MKRKVDKLSKLGYSTYQEYLNSPHWLDIKKRYMAYLNTQKQIPACACCKSKFRLSLHHKTYKRLGHENFGDLIMLCSECHEKLHLYAKGRFSIFKSTKQFIHKNKPKY